MGRMIVLYVVGGGTILYDVVDDVVVVVVVVWVVEVVAVVMISSSSSKSISEIAMSVIHVVGVLGNMGVIVASLWKMSSEGISKDLYRNVRKSLLNLFTHIA